MRIEEKKWFNMVRRCYDIEWQQKHGKHYIGHTVCKEWLNNREAFYEWVRANYYTIPGVQIDLDHNIIDIHNTVYAPDKCIFVPHDVNCFFEFVEPGTQIRQLNDGTYRVDITSKHSDPNYRAIHKLFKSCPAKNWNDALAQYVAQKTVLKHLLLDKYYGKVPKNVYDILCSKNIAQINKDKFRYDEAGKVPVYINGAGDLMVNYDTGEYWWAKEHEYIDLSHRIA